MSVKEPLKRWMDDGKYLPKFMRDFHNQKDLFKAMHRFINVGKHEYAGKVDWITGQCYVIDVFLWFMAMHGYTLQKSRQNVEFMDIDDTIEKYKP